MLQRKRMLSICQELEKLGATQMVISNPFSIYYLTGKMIEPMERLLALYISKNREPLLFLNKLFQCTEDLGIQKVWMDDNDDGALLISRYTDHQRPLAVDKDLTAKYFLPLMQYKAGSSYINGSIAVDSKRGIKDTEEQKYMILSSQLNDSAMNEIKKHLRPGITEAELARQLADIYTDLGAESGDGSVSFGKNCADPHHWPDNTVLQEGDCVMFDIGCSKNNYLSDMTRTYFFSSADTEARKIYEIVKQANEAAEKAIRPEMLFSEIDKIARDIIVQAGYGKYFNHRLGHFIGLEMHEFGDVSKNNNEKIRPGMIFSIEPGIYLPGKFGVRLEDLVLVTETGCCLLNHCSKDLQII